MTVLCLRTCVFSEHHTPGKPLTAGHFTKQTVFRDARFICWVIVRQQTHLHIWVYGADRSGSSEVDG